MKRALGLVLVAALWAAPISAVQQQIPPGEPDAVARLNASPRHGEWVTVDAGSGDQVRAWIVYPERPDPAPVVIVIQEIFGLTDWIRSVADQLAADGFIAIAPDMLSGKGPGGGGSESLDRQAATALVPRLDMAEVTRRLQAVAAYATALPAATDQVATVGFCWGGGTSFNLATQWPGLDAAVVYYGVSPAAADLARVNVPVLGNYGGSDARVTSTVAPAQAVLGQRGARYDVNIYEGAGHGFLRQQDGQDGANMRAAQQSWPKTVTFLRQVLGN